MQNVLAGALFSPAYATILLTLLTTVGSLCAALLSKPLAPLLTHFFPRALDVTRHAIEGDGETSSDDSGSKSSAWVRLSVLRLVGIVPWSGINLACGVCGVAIGGLHTWRVHWVIALDCGYLPGELLHYLSHGWLLRSFSYVIFSPVRLATSSRRSLPRRRQTRKQSPPSWHRQKSYSSSQFFPSCPLRPFLDVTSCGPSSLHRPPRLLRRRSPRGPGYRTGEPGSGLPPARPSLPNRSSKFSSRKNVP